MMEIERKILEIDRKALIARLKKLKAKKIFEGFIRVKYFDFSDARIHKKKDLLRVREISPRGKKLFTELVYKIYKGVKSGCKYYDECEIEIPGRGFEELSGLLCDLGLKQTMYYEKKRTLFIFGKIKIELDEHPKIPPFVEIEASSPVEINRAIKILDLSGYEQSAESIGALMKRKYPRIKLDGLKFLIKNLKK